MIQSTVYVVTDTIYRATEMEIVDAVGTAVRPANL